MFKYLTTINVFVTICICFYTGQTVAQSDFEKHHIANFFQAFPVCCFDIDYDGDVDIFCGGHFGDFARWMNDGNQNFSRITVQYNFSIHGVFIKDMDRDGDKDIVAAACYENGGVVWWENYGGGGLNKHYIDTDFWGSESVFAADFDGDDDVDVVSVSIYTNIIYLYLNNGNQSFSRHVIDGNFYGGHHVHGNDLDGDGDIDFVTASGGANGTPYAMWWENDGQANFTGYTLPGSISSTYCIHSEDINNDGDYDILAASHGAGKVVLWNNNGIGSFVQSVIDSDLQKAIWVHAGDLNRDGNMDVVASGRKDENKVVWYKNNGNSTFSKYIIDESSIDPRVIIPVDLDNDGDLDLVVTHEKGNSIDWWENKLSGTSEYISNPYIPSGPGDGWIGKNFAFSTGGSSSNLGHTIEYQFDWGDGEFSNWGSGITNHSFEYEGVFYVRAHARCQNHPNIISGWSNNLQVTISEIYEFNVSGQAIYFSNNNPIQNAVINVSGDVTQTKITPANGSYNVTVEAENSINLTPNKTKGENVGPFDITMFDAALTAQHSLGLIQLDINQQYAADADKSGLIQTYDAALIAQHAVGLPPMANSRVSEWLFNPTEKNLNNVITDVTNENFTGVIIGNVHGGWSHSEIYKKKTHLYPKMVKMKQLDIGTEVLFYVENNKNIISMDVEVVFDDRYVEFAALERTSISENFSILKNVEANRLITGMYSVVPTNQPGELLRITFKKKNNDYKNNTIQVIKLIINNKVYLNTTNELENDLNSEKPYFKLYQNYPNPFNSSTFIRYDVLKAGFGEIKIYNIFGQKIRTLVRRQVSKGYYETMWDGKDDEGEIVASGVYFYQLNINNFKSIKKLLMIE